MYTFMYRIHVGVSPSVARVAQTSPVAGPNARALEPSVEASVPEGRGPFQQNPQGLLGCIYTDTYTMYICIYHV